MPLRHLQPQVTSRKRYASPERVDEKPSKRRRVPDAADSDDDDDEPSSSNNGHTTVLASIPPRHAAFNPQPASHHNVVASHATLHPTPAVFNAQPASNDNIPATLAPIPPEATVSNPQPYSPVKKEEEEDDEIQIIEPPNRSTQAPPGVTDQERVITTEMANLRLTLKDLLGKEAFSKVDKAFRESEGKMQDSFA
ncbi:hypothetical protein CALCODRAFT_519918 [Calocera cornea HHB12733]|uniref:Uncharacterized protein n=1 Tax=Calocera cornea HHB12733 TaxID=1353952 RepID=A0A165DVF2_9BASI|nr:hypothetical protein CALCODRAFT_519918 [Calocera cornea HHB12733]